MPSIELVCVDQRQPVDVSDLPFPVRVDETPRSHRPTPLFQRDFEQLSGCMYHLGNPSLRDKPGFFANELLEDDRFPRMFLQFRFAFQAGVIDLISRLLDASPVHRIFFTSDYQFGPEAITRGGEMTLKEFIHMHDNRQLLLNACYTILGKADR